MANSKEESQTGQGSKKVLNYSWLFATGFVMVIVGIVVLAAASVLEGSSSTGVGIVIFIGPIPIVFGSGQDAILAALTAAVLAALTVVMVLFWRKKPT